MNTHQPEGREHSEEEVGGCWTGLEDRKADACRIAVNENNWKISYLDVEIIGKM
jgi:hypothetical protein